MDKTKVAQRWMAVRERLRVARLVVNLTPTPEAQHEFRLASEAMTRANQAANEAGVNAQTLVWA
jgi:hypothetical protein